MPVNLLPGTFHAWIDRMPGTGPRPHLVVVGDTDFVEVDIPIKLEPAKPQGINPRDLILDVVVGPQPSPHSNALARRTLRYEESPAPDYSSVTIVNGSQTFTIPVRQVS